MGKRGGSSVPTIDTNNARDAERFAFSTLAKRKEPRSGSFPSSTIIYIIIIVICICFIIFLLFFQPVFRNPFQYTSNNNTNDIIDLSGSPNRFQQTIAINNNGNTDPFYNVNSPPLRSNPYFRNAPLTITSPFSVNETNYSQMGILKYDDNTFLPLFGKPVSTSRDLWKYYAISNTGSMPGIKLTIRNAKGRNLMDDVGSPQLYDNDTVIVDGYNKNMQVSLYPQKNISYII